MERIVKDELVRYYNDQRIPEEVLDNLDDVVMFVNDFQRWYGHRIHIRNGYIPLSYTSNRSWMLSHSFGNAVDILPMSYDDIHPMVVALLDFIKQTNFKYDIVRLEGGANKRTWLHVSLKGLNGERRCLNQIV